MRKLCIAVAALCALATTTSLRAAERAEFQIMPRAGRGELKLDQFRNVDDRLAELDTGGLGVGFAVLTPVGLLVEGGTESYGHWDWFDDDDDEFFLRQYYVAVGYQFELGDGWHLIPKLGRSKWKLTSEDGPLLDGDDIARGYEYFWEAGFGKRINDVMSLGASVRSGDYEFGDAGSIAFVMTFSF